MTYFEEIAMAALVHVLKIGREQLPELIASGDSSLFVGETLHNVAGLQIDPRHIVVGHWGPPTADPFPDFIIVRDDEYEDTTAWLSAFLPSFAPLSQWCRLWKLSDLQRIAGANERPNLGTRLLGGWIGIILVEASSEGANLKEVSGASAAASATYCAARAVSVWGNFGGFEELAERHAALGGRNREHAIDRFRSQLQPIWYVLAGPRWQAKPPVDARALEVIRSLVEELSSAEFLSQDDIGSVAATLARRFDLPDLARCASGTQGQRVEALDKLGTRLLEGPKSVASSAIMGFAASLVDPGAAVMPELLRRYSSSLPSSSLWAGAFAGLWFPVRVLSEHGGLGRLIAKELLRPSDLFSKPEADVSFDELSRWTGGSFDARQAIRGLFARTLFVELYPGVSTPLQVARIESVRAESGASKQPSLDFERPSRSSPSRAGPSQAPSADLFARVEALERRFEEFVRKAKSARSSVNKGRG